MRKQPPKSPFGKGDLLLELFRIKKGTFRVTKIIPHKNSGLYEFLKLLPPSKRGFINHSPLEKGDKGGCIKQKKERKI